MSTTLARPNRYAATCIRCGGRVPANGGLLARDDQGAWAADHDGDCPPKPTAVGEPRLAVSQDGIYQTADGTIWKVQQARQGSGRLYAKKLVITTDDSGEHTATFVYVPGAIYTLAAEDRMSEEAARAFGALYGICCACGADLTDDTSIARGIGPICGAKYF